MSQAEQEIDERLDELSALLCHWIRLRGQGIRPVAVRAAALGIVDEIYDLVNEVNDDE